MNPTSKLFIPFHRRALLALTVLGVVVALSAPVHAAPSGADRLDGSDEFTTLCTDLGKIKGETLSKANCKSFSSQKDQNNADRKICAKYGTKELKDDCDAYRKAVTNGPTTSSGTSDSSSLFGTVDAQHQCGGGDGAIATSIDIGCDGKGNAMLDLAFAIIRFLSDGAGLVIIGSLVLAGIQYSISRGDPQATAAAVNRIRTVVVSLFIFMFAYAILNYLIPGQLLQ